MKAEIFDDLELVARAWDELAPRSEPSPWLERGWISAWWRAFGGGRLAIVALGNRDRVSALIPLARRWGALRSTANWHTPTFGIMAEDADAARDLAAAVFALAPRHVSLYFVQEGHAYFDACREAARVAGYATTSRVLERSPYVDTSGDWSAYEESLARKMRTEMRRRRRKLEEMGEVTMTIHDGKSRLGPLLEDGFRVEAAGWKGSAGSAIASRPETLGFYTEVARWAASSGSLRLGFLRCGGRAIAFDFAIETGGVHYLLKTGIDPAFSKYGPGMLIRKEMIESAFKSDVHTYDFLGRDDAWKMQWARNTHERLLFQAFRPDLGGRMDSAAFRYGRPAVKRLLGLVGR
ncbi:MAG: GNAT family N-acetyltransferase [Actinomycetota bacterium]|nr:GNAT family N-acetyltransferase [Actinomycetota bacterium]